MKDEQRSKTDFFENKLRNLEIEKAEISAKEQSLKENYSQMMKEKEQLEVELNERLDNTKKDYQRQLEEFKNKLY